MSAGLAITGIPVMDDPEVIRVAADGIRTAARSVHATAAAVQVDWCRMTGAYNAPEQQNVLSAMDAPSQRGLALVEKVGTAHAALRRYADRMAELDAQRSTLVLDIVAFEERRDTVEDENRGNNGWDNFTDLWAEESVNLARDEEALELRINFLAAAKDDAQNECVNAIGELWGAADYSRSGENHVKDPHVFGDTWDGYRDLSKRGEAPWGRPSSRTDGDWTVRLHRLESGAKGELFDVALGAADLAGLTTEGRAEAARSGMKQYGNDVWNVASWRDPGVATGPEKLESAQRLLEGARDSTGYGTWSHDGWYTAGTFIPSALGTAASGGSGLAPRSALRAAMTQRHIPGGSRLNPAQPVPSIGSRAGEIASTKVAALNHFLDTKLADLDGGVGPSPALAGSGVASSIRIRPQQTPPIDMGRMDATVRDHLYGTGPTPGAPTSEPSAPANPHSEGSVNLGRLAPFHSENLLPKPTALHLLPEGFDRYGGLSRQEFYDRHYDPEHGWRYPPRGGFDGEPIPNTLEAGDVIDRFGDAEGKYASPAGTPYPDRSVPPTSVSHSYTQYRVLKPLPPEVLEGRVAPAFRMPGGGKQYHFDQIIEHYIENGYLEHVQLSL